MKWLIASAGVFVVACGLSVSSTGDGVGDAGGSDAGSGAADGSPSNNDGGALADAGEDAPLPPPASCLDIKTLYAARARVPIATAIKRNMPRDFFSDELAHTHNALDDALGQAYLLQQLLGWQPPPRFVG